MSTTRCKIFLLACFVMHLTSAEQILSDADMITMSQRRIANHDFGFTWEQDQQRRSSGDVETKNVVPQIVARGTKNIEGAYPIRFKITFGMSESLNEQLLPSIIVDALFKKDAFGTWNMEWKYNTDQTLVLQDDKKKVLEKLGKGGIDIDLVNSIPDILKREVFPAQVQFQAGNYEDLNGNGIGDFAGDLDILCGVRQTKDGETLRYVTRKRFNELAASNVRYKLFAENERGFYAFMQSSLTGEIFFLSASGLVYKITERELPKNLAEAKIIEQKHKPK